MWTTAIAALIGLLSQVAKFFSAEAKLRRREVAEARTQAREQVEGERLQSTYRRIEAEPPKAAEDIVTDLNAKFRRKPP